MIKRIALIFFIFFLLLLIFFAVTWYNYFNGSGVDFVGGIFQIGLILATIYYFIFTVWTYRLLRSNLNSARSATIQLVSIFVLGVASGLGILTMLYRR